MKRSRVNLSHTHLTTMEMGKLVPFFWQDCLPGDVARIATNAVIKGQPMIAPLMHRVNILTQYYFVPYRILWDNWTEFITGGESGTATPEFPWMTSGTNGVTPNTLLDYFGIPINQANLKFSALPARAYNQIWNDHYKVEDIENEIDFVTTDGEDTLTPTNLLNCHWARDRFTRAKPFTQRGAQISVPVIPTSQSAEVYYLYNVTINTGTSTTTKPTGTEIARIRLGTKTGVAERTDRYDITALEILNETTSDIQSIEFKVQSPSITSGYITIENGNATSATISTTKSYTASIVYTESYIPVTSIVWGDIQGYETSPKTNFDKWTGWGTTIQQTRINYLDIEYIAETKKPSTTSGQITGTITPFGKQQAQNTGAINIRDLRVASALQRFQEKSLKYGAEYEDYCKMEFGVKPRDSRLNKSEYLGGSQTILQISEVLQTADGADSALGTQAGYSIGTARSRKIKYFCPEHGIIIGLCSIRPETIYTQGIDRDLLKTERFDFWTREMVGIGAQEIKEQEIYANADNAEAIFGYDLNGNYREYYSKRSRVSGNFRTDLNFWHLGRFFESQPVLNKSFIEMNPRKDIFAITDQTLPAFMCYFQNSALFYRPIPKRVKNKLA